MLALLIYSFYLLVILWGLLHPIIALYKFFAPGSYPLF